MKKKIEELKNSIFLENKRLASSGLVTLTWGNVSGYDPESGIVAIKPSGVDYADMTAADIVLLDLQGSVIEGKLSPSSDTPTHLEIYRNFEGVYGIVHTHSHYAVSWGQAGRTIPAMGTTHADHFYGDIPCTRKLTPVEVQHDYELNTGKVIVEIFTGIDPLAIPAVIVNDHGPFAWGPTVKKAVDNAIALEAVAKMAYLTVRLGGEERVDHWLLDKHYKRKHGKDSYYGQNKRK